MWLPMRHSKDNNEYDDDDAKTNDDDDANDDAETDDDDDDDMEEIDDDYAGPKHVERKKRSMPAGNRIELTRECSKFYHCCAIVVSILYHNCF